MGGGVASIISLKELRRANIKCTPCRSYMARWHSLLAKSNAVVITNPDPAVAKRAFQAMMEMRKICIAAIEAAVCG
jgi:2-polyprenyl-6-hydroxyphenyl methylase/3-demethylubiquinone-9 3-methyltransferase